MEGILLRTLKARGIVVEQPFVPESLKIVEEGGVTGSHVEVIIVSGVSLGAVNRDGLACDFQATVAKLDESYLQANSVRQTDRGKLIETEEAIVERQVIRAKYVLGCDGERSNETSPRNY